MLGNGGTSSPQTHAGDSGAESASTAQLVPKYCDGGAGDADGRGDGEVGGAVGPYRSGERGRVRLRPPTGEVRGAAAASSSPVLHNGGGDRSTGRSTSSPAAVRGRKNGAGNGVRSLSTTTGALGRSTAGATGDRAMRTAVAAQNDEGVRTLKGATMDAHGEKQQGDAHQCKGRNATSTASSAAAPATTTAPRKLATAGGSSMLTMQTCFKQEREAFIQDLQVLHRQLEAKDRDHARRERESQAACARARADARAAQERTVSLQKDADGAAAALAAAVARAGAASEGLDR